MIEIGLDGEAMVQPYLDKSLDKVVKKQVMSSSCLSIENEGQKGVKTKLLNAAGFVGPTSAQQGQFEVIEQAHSIFKRLSNTFDNSITFDQSMRTSKPK